MCMSSGKSYTPPPPQEVIAPAPPPRMGNKNDVAPGANTTKKRRGTRSDLVIDLAPGQGVSSGVMIPS